MWILLSLALLCALPDRSACKQYASRARPEDVQRAFKTSSLVPNVIPRAPDLFMPSIFGDRKYTINLGNNIPPCATTTTGYWSIPNASPDELYTIIYFDADYPQFYTTNSDHQYLHGLVVNKSGADYGELVYPILPANPLPGTGFHRYVVLAYQQSSSIKVTKDFVIGLNSLPYNFSIADFVERYDLGDPVAGNFFVTQQSLCAYALK